MNPLWAWNSEKAKRHFERRYTAERQALLFQKIELYCLHQLGDIDQFEGTPYSRLKVIPDRIIFYLGEESGTFWIVGIEPRSKRTYRKQ